MNAPRRVRQLIKARRLSKARIASNDYGELIVKRTKRGVKIIAMTDPSGPWTGKRTGATYAVVDLDDEGVDRLIRRLQAIRGGRSALKLV